METNCFFESKPNLIAYTPRPSKFSKEQQTRQGLSMPLIMNVSSSPNDDADDDDDVDADDEWGWFVDNQARELPTFPLLSDKDLLPSTGKRKRWAGSLAGIG